MVYIARIETEGDAVLVSFPDCPGCQTFGENMDQALASAHEALAGWLETQLQEGDLPPRPAFRGDGVAVRVPAALGLKLQLRWARADAGLSQSQLAKRLGVTQQMIGKLEHPDYEPSITRLEEAVKALGGTLEANITRTKKKPGAHVEDFGISVRMPPSPRKAGKPVPKKRAHSSLSHR